MNYERTDVAELKHEMEEGCGESPAKYRKFYKDKYGKDSKLTNDQIYLMVGNAEDDNDPDGWAETMLAIEQTK